MRPVIFVVDDSLIQPCGDLSICFVKFLGVWGELVAKSSGRSAN